MNRWLLTWNSNTESIWSRAGGDDRYVEKNRMSRLSV